MSYVCIIIGESNQYKIRHKMSKEIKDQTVNSFNAEITEELSTPELRQMVAETIVDRAFKRVGKVEFHHLSEFDRLSPNIAPSVYWVYTFRCSAITYSGGYFKLNTITLSSDGGVEFNFHSCTIKNMTL